MRRSFELPKPLLKIRLITSVKNFTYFSWKYLNFPRYQTKFQESAVIHDISKRAPDQGVFIFKTFR